jgi:hypothetical protein
VLDLDQLKVHLKLIPSATGEDELLRGYLAAAQAAFFKLSKRRWPKTAEPTDDDGAYLDEAVLDEQEQAIAQQWLLLAIGHWYENRQEVVTDTRVASVQVPMACEFLMNLVRTPTL